MLLSAALLIIIITPSEKKTIFKLKLLPESRGAQGIGCSQRDLFGNNILVIVSAEDRLFIAVATFHLWTVD